ncbi:MAG: hypothetical protein PVJ39_21820 [Gammaproteobacteria bacterium]
MKKVYIRSILALPVILVILLSACSLTEPQDTTADKAADKSAGQETGQNEAAAGGEKQAASEEKAEQVPEQKPEPVVEVIPSQSAGEEALQVEPMKTPAEPQQTETEQQPVTTGDQSGAEAPKTVPIPTDPNHFVITVGAKTPSHPFYGKGHSMGFSVNNVPGKELVMERGKTYTIDVVTNPKHDVYLSLKGVGWGSTPYSEGVQGMYTYKGTITFTPTDKTPDLLYYSCRNHPYMGGKIHIVDPGETVDIKKTTTAAAPAAKAAARKISAGDVNQKIMYANMLINSKNSQTVLDSRISEAIALHKKASGELQAAKDSLKAGNNEQAYKQAENAVALIQKATKLVPNESALERMKEHYGELQASIKDFQKSHQQNYDRIVKKQGPEAAVDYDRKVVAELISSAADFAKQGDYLKANHNLEKAQRAITVAIHKMLNNQTIVYDLNFENAQEEYEYELRRFEGYAELIPIAVEQKKPKPGAKKLMESFVKKGTDLRDRAVKAAEAGDYPTAIAMLQDATKDVRRGLRMIGVMQ